MKTFHIPKTILCIAASLTLLLSTIPMPARAVSVPILSIESSEVTLDQAAAGETIALEVTISDNPDGFLATSFGIQYDDDLTLVDVQTENAAGIAHTFCVNEKRSLIWFCGASSGASSANFDSSETIFTLFFSLPSDAAAETVYPVSFCWTKLNQKPGLWVAADRTDIFESVRSSAVNGGITVVDPNAPKLSHEELQLSVGSSRTLSVANAESVLWVTTASSVAQVENGVVTGISEGSCMIYAIADNKMLACAVTVTKDGIYDIMGEGMQTIFLRDPEQTVTLTCSEYDGDITWRSYNEDVVKVDSNGTLEGIANGSAMVFAYCGADIYFAKIVVEYPQRGTGDVTLDGSVNIADVLALNRSLLTGDPLDKEQQLESDVNLDAAINAADALLILQHAVKIVETLPIT